MTKPLSALILKPWNLFYTLSLGGITLASLIWVPAWLIQRGILPGSSYGGYPAYIHSEQMLALFFVPALTAFLLRRSLLHSLLPDRFWIYGLLAMELGLFPLSYFQDHTLFYALLFVVFVTLLWIFRGMVQWKNRSSLYLGLGLLLGALTAFFLYTSTSPRQSWMFVGARSLLETGLFLFLPVEMALINLRFPGEPSRSSRFYIADALVVILFFLSFLVEWITLGALNQPAPYLFTYGIRLFTGGYWMALRFLRDREERETRGISPGVTAALFLSLAGLVSLALFIGKGSHLAHLLFMGGVTLLLFYSHMALYYTPRQLEKSTPGRITIALLLLATVARLGGLFHSGTGPLLSSVVLLLGAIAGWIYLVVKGSKETGQTELF